MDATRPGFRLHAIVLIFALAIIGAAAGCGGSGGPSTPVTPTPTGGTPSVTLAIAGGADLQTPGASAQLMVTATPTGGAAMDVTASAEWLSSNPAVASVTGGGFVTAAALGTTTITASYQRQTVSLEVAITSGAGTIAGCGSLRGPGPFTLTADVPQTSGLCLVFSGIADTSLDCQGHDARSLNVLSAHGFAIRNCRFHGTIPNLVGVALQNFRIASATSLVVDGVDVLGAASVRNCQDCLITRSTFVYPQTGFTPGDGFVSGELVVTDGAGVSIVGNTVDGGWDGGTGATYQRQGCDDGILFHRTIDLRIEGNVIVNAFDAGIEPSAGTAPLTVVIRDNTIRHMGYTGIGAYYEWGWRGSVFSGNTVEDSPNFLTFNTAGASIGDVTAITFVDNVIEHNVFRGPVPLPPRYGGRIVPSMIIAYAPGGLPHDVSNNVIRSNDFGLASPAPVLEPASGFVDGGGNTCPTGGVLACGAIGSRW